MPASWAWGPAQRRVRSHPGGCVAGARKRHGVGMSVFTFAGGSAAWNAFIHENPALESWPVDKVNLPDRTVANPGIVSINSTA